MRLPRFAALGAALVLAGAGCGGDDEPASGKGAATPAAPVPVELALDFTPNAIHAPLYAARERGLDRRHGIALTIRRPGPGPDALKLLAAGTVDVGLLDIHDLGLARQRGEDLVGFGALVQRPLAALVARRGIERPRELEGKTIGVSGLPSDPAFVRAVIEGDGGDAATTKQVEIGFGSVAALLAGRVDAAPVFWNAEGVALRRRGFRGREFRVDAYGAPPYPEVVLIATAETVRERPELLKAVSAALRDGIAAVRADPAQAARVVAAAGRADPALTRAQLDAVLPLFEPPLRLDRDVLEQWAAFDERFGILDAEPDVDAAFAFGLTGF